MTEWKHRAAVRMSAAAAVLAVGFWPAAAPSSGKPEWIVNQSAVSLLGGAGLTHAQLQILFGNDRTYLIRGLTQTAAAPVSGALQTVSFTSYQAMARQFAGPGLPAGTRAVLYDNEDWSFTPVGEQRDPARYEELAASLSTFTSFVQSAAAQARRANRHVTVLAGLSTNPSGQHVTSGQLLAAYNAAQPNVNGYWLNIPSGGPYCPRCGTPQPQVAVPLLRMLLNGR